MCAISPGHSGCALKLLSRGANPLVVNTRKHSLLHILAKSYKDDRNSEKVLAQVVMFQYNRFYDYYFHLGWIQIFKQN